MAATRPDFEDIEALRKRYAGQLGVDSGPVPLRRWMPQPAVNTQNPDPDYLPNGGKPQRQNLRPEVKRDDRRRK